jgi:hypothetical protein
MAHARIAKAYFINPSHNSVLEGLRIYVTAVTNAHETIEECLYAQFYMRSVPYKEK